MKAPPEGAWALGVPATGGAVVGSRLRPKASSGSLFGSRAGGSCAVGLPLRRKRPPGGGDANCDFHPSESWMLANPREPFRVGSPFGFGFLGLALLESAGTGADAGSCVDVLCTGGTGTVVSSCRGCNSTCGVEVGASGSGSALGCAMRSAAGGAGGSSP